MLLLDEWGFRRLHHGRLYSFHLDPDVKNCLNSQVTRVKRKKGKYIDLVTALA